MSIQRNQREPMAQINVVPYVDVMLVLLVIFMVTAPLLSQGVVVDLPQAQARSLAENEQQPLIVSVDAGGNYYLNIAAQPERPISDVDLMTLVQNQLASDPQRTVLVRGDQQVRYGLVVGAMVLLQEAGVPTVGLVTETPTEQG